MKRYKVSEELAARFDDLKLEMQTADAQAEVLYKMMACHRKGIEEVRKKLWEEAIAETSAKLNENWFYDCLSREIQLKAAPKKASKR